MKPSSRTLQKPAATVIYSAANRTRMADADLLDSIKKHEVWRFFAVQDIKLRFRRSLIGPLWISISLLLWISALGTLMTQVFGQELAIILPYISVGIVFWTFFATCMNEGCMVFVEKAGFIRSVPLQLSCYLYQLIFRNLIILGFNMLIYLLIFAVFVHDLSWTYLFFIPGFLLFGANILWMTLFLGIFSARFRDIAQIVQVLIQVLFFFTPIFWSIDFVPNRLAFVTINPLYHLIEVVRAPLLGKEPELLSWIATAGMLIIGSGITWRLYRYSYAKIPYWL